MLLPIPGSPPSKIKDPGTIPPPKTLFISESFESNLGFLVVSISEIFRGLDILCFSCFEPDFQSPFFEI